MKANTIIDTIKRNLSINGYTHINIHEKSFLENIVRGDKEGEGRVSCETRLKALGFVLYVVFVFVFVVMSIIFITKDILFFSPKNYVNDYGAMVMKQPNGVEYNMFMINTAQYWTNTGIKVMAGDEVQLFYSGNFYSDIGDMKVAASNNTQPKYWHEQKSSPNKSIQLCVYSAETSADKGRFGSILMQVQEDKAHLINHADTPNGDIIQAKENGTKDGTSFRAKKNGYLYVTTNDILFTKEVCRNIAETSLEQFIDIIDTRDTLKNKQPGTFKLHRKNFAFFPPDTINMKDYYLFNVKDNETNDTILSDIAQKLQNSILENKVDSFKKADTLARKALEEELSRDSLMWYKDNAGEYMLTIKIARHNASIYERFFRSIDDIGGEFSAIVLLGIIIIPLLFTSLYYCYRSKLKIENLKNWFKHTLLRKKRDTSKVEDGDQPEA